MPDDSDIREVVARAVRKKRDMDLCKLCDRPTRTMRCTCAEIADAAIAAVRAYDAETLNRVVLGGDGVVSEEN